jgi:hypothetical protein
MSIFHWLLALTGAKDEAGSWYGFWSGFGGSVPDFLLLGGLITLVKKHNCHQGRCWRIGRHTVDGTPWCNRHHEAARKRQDENHTA